MEQYEVTGMTCAACVARVEKAVNKVPGVTGCAVSLLTNSMGVEGSAAPDAVIAAVTAAGYGASQKGTAAVQKKTDALEDKQTPLLKKRLLASIGFLLLLMYISMGHSMWGWPLPGILNGNPIGAGIAQLLLAGIVMVINQRFFISGFTSLRHGSPNMDTLVALGSSASFLWSVAVLFSMTGAQLRGEATMPRLHELYFESAAMILTLITVGKMLEARSKGKTTDALKSLMNLAPQSAVILEDGIEKTVPVEQVHKGDLFVVRPGQSFPVDGVVLEGSSAVNEAALTGESIPVDKQPGDNVSAATINQSGFLKCRASRVGEDTTLSQIIKMVSDAAATKAPIAKLADKVSGVFVPAVITIAVITTLVWLLLGRDFAYSLARGISVLVISCPCALGLATPVAIMVGSGVGARNGILFKTAVSLEETGKVDIVALDKTGTITTGAPVVTDLIPAEGITDRQLLTLAAALEAHSEHPLARAVLEAAGKLDLPKVTDFTALPGSGLQAVLEGSPLLGGSLRYISEKVTIPEGMKQQAQQLAQQGKTPLAFARGDRFLGLIAVADAIRPDSPEAVRRLRNMGIRVVMLTGDNERTAKAIGAQAGVDEVIAGVLPDGKDQVISRLKLQGRVAMVGDGINDAPALTRADMGIAIGAGADVAIDAADVVLMRSSLMDVPAAIALSRGTLHNIKQNLFWAFCYNVIGIPLAAGCLSGLGLTLNPMFGAAAMSLSSFCVVSNALRLNFIRLHDASADQKKQRKEPAVSAQPEELTRIANVEGMMCEHCERAVKEALEALPQVISAQADHQTGRVTITCRPGLEEEAVRQAVEAEDYTFLSLE